jgi:prepilin-type N-terminal cleavage/methylation domain-containing protein
MHSRTFTRATSKEQGFTLVELAIVLVIIGLIVGGVLVGQDLIKAAEIRATVSQMEKYNSAVNTFRGKFGGYPGDLLASRAATFNLQTRNGADGRGDGDGLVEGYNGTAATANALGSENVLFWRDLAAASLIPDGFSTATDAPAASLTAANLSSYLPRSKMRESTYFSILASGGRNFFYIDQITATAATTGVITSTGDGLTPLESKSIDEKIDDGLPGTGLARAVTGIAATGTNYTADAGSAVTAGTSSPTVCVNTTTTPDDYNVQELDANIPNCGLVARSSF